MSEFKKKQRVRAGISLTQTDFSICCDPGDLHGKGLKRGNWSFATHNILNSWLKYFQESQDADSQVAVFDFDNTCIYRDVGKIVFRYQLENLQFRLTPLQFATLFPDNIETIKGISFTAVRERLEELYTLLFPFMNEVQREKVVHCAEYIEFVGLLSWYCEAARREEGLGPLYSLPLFAQFLAGYTTEEVADLTCHAIMNALYEPIGVRVKQVRCCEGIGTLTIRDKTGIRVQQEILDLMNQLRYIGIRCCIVSASAEWIVKATAIFFDFPVKEQDVFGIRLQLDSGEKLTTDSPDDYPVTYRAGKVDIINEIIKKPPVLVAGDAITDFEMLHLPMVPLRLLINHNKSGLISTLYNDPRFLVQGLDKKTGAFRACKETLERPESRSCPSSIQSASQSPFANAA